MGVLKFDAYAVLAEIETRQHSGANSANLANPAPSPAPISRISKISRAQLSKPTLSDPERYLAHLREIGPTTYGAAASALGWGATRAWQAEARLGAGGKIRIGTDGRAYLSKGSSESTALVGNARQGVRWPEGQQ